MASRGQGRGRRGRPWGTPFVFYQQAFAKAVDVAVATIAQASAVGGQGGPSDLQRLMARHPPTCMEGGDSVVRTALAIGEDDMQSIWYLGDSAKRKEIQPSSSSRKKQKTSISHESQGQDCGHQGQGQGQLSKGGGHFRTPTQSR